jgi:hypothetical protein
MNSAAHANHRLHLGASGGVLIGLLLATLVILGGFSLVPATGESVQTEAFPTWVDQRFAETGPYQTVPTPLPQLAKQMSVAGRSAR